MSNRKSKRGGFIGPFDKRKYNKLIKEEGLETCENFYFDEGFDCDTGTSDPTYCPKHCKEGESSSGSSICNSSGGPCIPNYKYKKKSKKGGRTRVNRRNSKKRSKK